MEIRFPRITFNFELDKPRGWNQPFRLKTKLEIESGSREALWKPWIPRLAVRILPFSPKIFGVDLSKRGIRYYKRKLVAGWRVAVLVSTRFEQGEIGSNADVCPYTSNCGSLGKPECRGIGPTLRRFRYWTEPMTTRVVCSRAPVKAILCPKNSLSGLTIYLLKDAGLQVEEKAATTAFPVAPFVSKFGPEQKINYTVEAEIYADNAYGIERLIEGLKLVPVALKRSMQDQLDGFRGQTFKYKWTSRGQTLTKKSHKDVVVFV